MTHHYKRFFSSQYLLLMKDQAQKCIYIRWYKKWLNFHTRRFINLRSGFLCNSNKQKEEKSSCFTHMFALIFNWPSFSSLKITKVFLNLVMEVSVKEWSLWINDFSPMRCDFHKISHVVTPWATLETPTRNLGAQVITSKPYWHDHEHTKDNKLM